MRRKLESTGGITLLNVVLIFIIVAVVAALLFPVFTRTCRGGAPKSSCQYNLKEITTGIIMYEDDYDGMLPSSALRGRKTWNEESYKRFATQLGGDGEATWVSLMHSYLKSQDVIWCPSDPNCPSDFDVRRTGLASYWYKAAIDRAWFGGTDSNGKWACKREGDFGFATDDQVVLYEHASWHWLEADKGLTNGVILNCGFVDGHVATKRIKDSSQARGKADPTAPGEPNWFNYDCANRKSIGVGKFFDARRLGDDLR